MPRVLAAAAIGLAALALRAYNLGGPSLWADEANTVARASLPLPRLLDTLASSDSHPPLYYLLLHPWLAWFGTSEVGLRSFSVVWGLAAVVLVWLAARELAGPRAAMVGAAMAATAPALVLLAQEGRGYTLLALIELVTFWLLRRALASGRRRDWAAFSLASAAGLYTHNLALLGVGWQALVVLTTSGGRARANLGRFVLAQAAAYVGYLAWLPAFVVQLRSFATGGAWLGPPGVERLAFTGLSFLGGASYYREGDLRPDLLLEHPYLLVGPCLLVYVGARRLAAPDRAALLLLALGPVLTVFMVAQLLPVYVDRAVLVSVFGLAVLAAAAFRPPLPRAEAAVLGAALVATLGLHLAASLAFYRQPRDDYRRLAFDVARLAAPGDLVLFVPGFGRVAFEYYWRRAPGQARLADLDLPSSRAEPLLTESGDDVWVIRVAAPPPTAAVDLPQQLATHGLRWVDRRAYPDDLLTLDRYAR